MAGIKISSPIELEKWLQDKPREVAVAIAMRAALRVFPLLLPASSVHNFESVIFLPIGRAATLLWAAAVYPTHDNVLKAAIAAAAADAARAVAAYPFAAALRAVAADDDAVVRGNVIIAVVRADASANAFSFAATITIWGAVSKDIQFLVDSHEEEEEWGMLASKLAQQKLWPGAIPDWVEESWCKMSSYLETQGDNWQVWKKWYEARLHGQPTVKASAQKNEEVDLAIARLSDEDWEKGPAHVNGIIAKLFEEAEENGENPMPVDNKTSSQTHKAQAQKFSENFQTISLMVDSLVKANAAERENHHQTAKPNDLERLEEWQALDRYFELTGNKLHEIQAELEKVEKEEDLEEASETTVSLLNEYRDEIIRQLRENKENNVRLILGTASITGATAIFSLAGITPLAGFGAALTFYGAKDVLKNLKDRFLSKSE